MCGIIGIVGHSPVNQHLFDGLTVLQHRGQDAAGIMTCDNNRFYLRKANGLVKDVFHTRHMQRLQGNMGIGHVRYPTAGSTSSAEAQPLYVNSPFGIALGHNGNLNNAQALEKELFEQDYRHVNTDSDSEILLNVFAQELQNQEHSLPLPEKVFAAVSGVHHRCRGAYAVIAMVVGFGILGFRDPNGIRPIVYGRKKVAQGYEYIIASESVALDALGFELIADLQPGESVYITEQGEVHTKICVDDPKLTPCIFEHVYFARPDSFIDGISVHKARMKMGVTLGDQIAKQWPNHDIDVVIPVPESGRTSALELATRLGVKYREGFIKNRYIGRTFIMPGQEVRKKSVRQKLNAIELEFSGKNVLIVDDSVVRGTTSTEIIQMARDAGAEKVYFASAAPEVRYQNVYGIDMPAAEELIAHDRSVEEIRIILGADKLFYQTLDDLIEAINKGTKKIESFDCSVFDGKYVSAVSQDYLHRIGKSRSDDNREAQTEQLEGIDIYNSA